MTKQPDWTQAPEWAQWHAIDSDGEGCWFEDKPFFVESHSFWLRGGIGSMKTEDWYKPTKNWQQSLQERPK